MVCYFKRICGINQAEDRVTWPDLLHRHTIALASFREWSVVSARLRIRAQPRNPCRARNSASAWTWLYDSCHNFDCENSMTDAWVVAWKNKRQRDILEPPNCAHYNQHLPHVLKTLPTGSEVDALDPLPTALVFTDHCLEWSTELFASIIHENTLLAQRGLLIVLNVSMKATSYVLRSNAHATQSLATSVSPIVFVFGWRLRPPTIYDEIGAAACNIHCYTVIGFW